MSHFNYSKVTLSKSVKWNFLQFIEVTFISYILNEMIFFILVSEHIEEHLKDLVKHTLTLNYNIISQCSEECASEIIQLIKMLHHKSYKELNQTKIIIFHPTLT